MGAKRSFEPRLNQLGDSAVEEEGRFPQAQAAVLYPRLRAFKRDPRLKIVKAAAAGVMLKRGVVELDRPAQVPTGIGGAQTFGSRHVEIDFSRRRLQPRRAQKSIPARHRTVPAVKLYLEARREPVRDAAGKIQPLRADVQLRRMKNQTL